MPELAITLGLAEILAADRILLVVIGSAKAEVLGRAFGNPPARSCRPAGCNCTPP
jgi:glucosamine-6-phosphate deaminase